MTGTFFDRDALLAAVAALFAAASVVLLAQPPPALRGEGGGEPPVATITAASSPLRLRPADALGWSNVAAGVPVHERDALFVPPGAEARLTFLDGTTVELDERSLVVVEAPPRGGRQVSLRQGSLAGTAGRAGLVVSTPGGSARLGANAQAQVAVGKEGAVQVEVTKGEAQVQGAQGSASVREGQRGELSAQGFQAAAPWPVALDLPQRGQRRFFRGTPPTMELKWSGEVPAEARVQLARDRGFNFLLNAPRAEGGALQYQPAEAGVYWWRVVDPDGEAVSEARRFSLLEDVPPAPLAPRAAEVVLSTPEHPVTFTWTQVRGVARYRLELSASPDFREVALEQTVDAPRARLVLDLPEGTWHWRVRSADEDRGDSGPCDPIAFRLIHKEILDAPELETPEIEVTREGKPGK